MDVIGICLAGMAVSAALVVWGLVTAELGGGGALRKRAARTDWL